MKRTQSIKRNHQFQRLYRRGKSATSPFLALYYRKSPRKTNQLGLTVGLKVGKAVQRNKVRRRLKEIYRHHEDRFISGLELVVVARVRANHATYQELERSFLHTAEKLGILRPEDKP